MSEPIAYSVEDAVKISGLGRSTLYEALASGGLSGRKIGRRTLILRDDLEGYLRAGQPFVEAKSKVAANG